MTDLNQLGQAARAAGAMLALAPSSQKDAALRGIARALRERAADVLAANAADMEQAQAIGLAPGLLDRLLLNEQRLEACAAEVEHVAALADPVGEVFEAASAPNGLRIHKRRVPFGVIAMIYESRPSVTVEVATLCLKTGNATLLRGGNETQQSNLALTALIRDAISAAGLPADAVQLIADPDRALVRQLLRLDQYVDLLIPRGGPSLQQFCRQHATMPVILSGTGVCHIYVDQTADLARAIPVIRNAKVQLPTACNAAETLLVDRAVAAQFLPMVAADLLGQGVELRVDEEALALLHAAGMTDSRIVPARSSDFGTEFMGSIMSVRVVDGIAEALAHIARYSSGLCEAILAGDADVSAAFVQAVDAATVFVNASTRFNDAGHLGLGAELGQSTQKLHVRGPITLRDLTAYKWVVQGEWHVRA
jgi:glutamate-5-semialdehyde dehydrogenase